MNRNGTVSNLVASQPGNKNALKHGAYSDGRVLDIAEKVEAVLLEQYVFSPSQRLLVREFAREEALLELIDQDINNRGLVSKNNKPHPLLRHRNAAARRRSTVLAQLARTMDRQDAANDPSPPARSSEEIRRELHNIATGRHSEATPREQIAAAKTLRDFDAEPRDRGTVTLVIRHDKDGTPHVECEDGVEDGDESNDDG